MSVMTQPISPGVGARRKGPKIPRLPLSAFTPPNSGTSEKFPLPPSPSTIHPLAVVDAGVAIPLEQWQSQAAGDFASKAQGVVLELKGKAADLSDAIALAQKNPAVIAVSLPLPLDGGAPANVPPFLESPPPNLAIGLSVTFTKFTPALADGIHWAVARGLVVDIDVQTDLTTEEGWEALTELLSSALSSERPQGSAARKGAVVLSNVLPAPHDTSLPLVKLLTAPVYRLFQDQMSTVSLFPGVYAKFAPPTWAPVADVRERKRRIKMYLGHVVEAFGYERILFASRCQHPAEWYAVSRECLAELGVEQEAVDGVFAGNARLVYSV